jgi:Zn-dependent protease with chaperone function
MASRALLALALMIGFYVLALAIATALLSIPYLEWVGLHRVHPKLALVCIVAAGTIVWSVLPRPDRFEPPGPRLEASTHPHLFVLIQRVARATNQAPPAEVYLVRDMNAFVTQRGGIMGLGSRRVMGLGLPLLQTLDVTQLEAVLAHEFGHYHGGDVKLGPWIYKTRAAIVRTVAKLAEGGSRILHKPFVWYGKLFLRITHALSRRQEYAADALAAEVVGARPLVEGLKLVAGGAVGFELYWREDVVPALEAGFRPPLLAGFTRFLAVPRAKELMDKVVAEELSAQERDPYDTHPALPDRIAALAGLPPLAPATTVDARPAITLLDADLVLEHDLLRSLAVDPARVNALTAIDWSEVGQRVYVRMWESAMSGLRAHLAAGGAELRAGSLSGDQRFFAELGRRVLGADAAGAPEEALAKFGASNVATALAHQMVQAGWSVRALPGEPVVLQHDGKSFEPFTRLVELATGKLTPQEWQAACAAAGISDAALV